jgi:glutathione S-transferase
MLRIFGRLSSINVRKVVLVARLLEIPFERIDAGLAHGIVQTPEYLEKNPNAMVPLIEDDGFALWESNVIVRYLCARHAPGRLYPEPLRERFDAERWMDWQQTTLNPAGRDAFTQLIRLPPEKRSQAAVKASIDATGPLLALLDQHLARQTFIAGDALTMADISIACEMHRWWGLPLEHPQHPNLGRWWEAMRSLPASRSVLDLPLS